MDYDCRHLVRELAQAAVESTALGLWTGLDGNIGFGSLVGRVGVWAWMNAMGDDTGASSSSGCSESTYVVESALLCLEETRLGANRSSDPVYFLIPPTRVVELGTKVEM
jgi:hypothetical protein